MNKLFFSTLSLVLIFALIRADNISKQSIEKEAAIIEKNLILGLTGCINQQFDNETCENVVFKTNKRNHSKQDMKLALEAFNNLYEINCSQEYEKLTYECKLIEAMYKNHVSHYNSLN